MFQNEIRQNAILRSYRKGNVKVEYSSSSQSYGASLATWYHTVLPATRHKWTCPALTPANQAGTRFTYPGGMEGWVELDSLIAAAALFYSPVNKTTQGARPGIEPTTAWSQVRNPNHYATQTRPIAKLKQYHLRTIGLFNYPTFISLLFTSVTS